MGGAPIPEVQNPIPANQYQHPAFDASKMHVDAYGLPPIGGLQQAPTLPQVQEGLPFPDAPTSQPKSRMQGLLRQAAPIGAGLLGSAVGGPVGGLLGGLFARNAMGEGGGLLGRMFGGDGLFSGQGGGYSGPMSFVDPSQFGGGSAASGFVQGGFAPAGTAFRDSMGGVSVSLGNGQSERTNSYGVTERDLGGGNYARVF